MKPKKLTKLQKQYMRYVRVEVGKKREKDPDIIALYLLDHAMKLSSKRMRKANLEFVLPKYKLKVV